MSKHAPLLAAAAIIAASSLAAHADTISTFSLNGAVFQSGANAFGTITIDTTTGVVTGFDLVYHLNLMGSDIF